MNKFILIFAMCALLALSGCATSPGEEVIATPPADTGDENGNTQMANPASVHCEDSGGTLEILDEEAGQLGMCHLPDGTVCEEWAYFRGECPAGADTPASSCTCPEGYVQEGDACNPKCYYSEPRCLAPSIRCTASPDCSGGCPMLSPPGPEFCKEGTIVSGGKNDCGCDLPPKCDSGSDGTVTSPDAPVACTEEAKLCPDGSAVGRTGPNCEFAPCPGEDASDDGTGSAEPERHYCTPESKKTKACTMEYRPVCGWFGPEVRCIKYPCAITAGNPCTACANENVEYWTEGECPE